MDALRRHWKSKEIKMNKTLVWLALFAAALTGCKTAPPPNPAAANPATLPGYKDTPMLPGGKWHVHDPDRPQPVVVTPGTFSSQKAPGKPPSDHRRRTVVVVPASELPRRDQHVVRTLAVRSRRRPDLVVDGRRPGRHGAAVRDREHPDDGGAVAATATAVRRLPASGAAPVAGQSTTTALAQLDDLSA